MNQSPTDRPAAARGRVSLEHQVFEVSVYRSSGYESSSLTLLHEVKSNRNGANSKEERMVEEEPQKQSQDVIEPEAEEKSEESSSENVQHIEAIPEIHESLCQQESVPDKRLEDGENEGIRKNDEDDEQVEKAKANVTGKRRIIKKEGKKQSLRKESIQSHSKTRNRRLKMKLRKRKGSVNYNKGINAIVELHEEGVSQKEISLTFGIQRSNLNKWKNQNNYAIQKELDSKNNSNYETIYVNKNSKTEKIKHNALALFRQGMTLSQIASKMFLGKNKLEAWTRPLRIEFKNKYFEGLKKIQTAIFNNKKEGSLLLFKEFEKLYYQTFIDDIFLSSKDWIFFTIKKLKIHERFKLVKSRNWNRVGNEEIMENSKRLWSKYGFLRNSEEDKKEVLELYKQGKTLTQICSSMFLSEESIRKLIQQIEEENMYFGWNENESLKVYQEIVKNKEKGSVITKREIKDFAHKHIADPTFMAVDEWVEKFVEFYKLQKNYKMKHRQ